MEFLLKTCWSVSEKGFLQDVRHDLWEISARMQGAVADLRQLNSGKIYRKVGRADCGNDFSDFAPEPALTKASDILRNPLSDRSLSHRGFQLTCLKTHFLNLQKEIMPCTPWPVFSSPLHFPAQRQ